MMARNMGMQRGRAFAGLDEAERRIMTAFGIGEHEWQALSAAPWTVGREGRTFLLPNDAQAIPDADIAAYAIASGRTDFTPAEARNHIGHRLRAYYADRRDFAVLNPGTRERAALYRGTSADTAHGMALRLGLQFKSFMVSSILRQWGREIYGQPGGLNQVYGIAQFMTAATVLGMASNALSQLFKGQDPFSQFENDLPAAVGAGFLRGGAASIAGDFLFGELGRHGTSFGQYVAGPTGSDISKVLAAVYKIKNGDNPAGDLVGLARGATPYGNFLWTKLALDGLLWNGLAEMANPGYQKRAERRLKKTQGLEFLKHPVDFSPNSFRLF